MTLEVIKKIYEHFINECGTEEFGYKDILTYLESHPEVKKINAKFQRDEGLAKSIKEDRIVQLHESN